MRLLTTLLMLVLVLAGGAWLVVGDRLLGPGTAPAVATADSTTRLLAGLRPEAVRGIDLTPPGQPAVSLTRNPDGTWTQPGNWPVRSSEANSLLNALTGLRSRFRPIPLAGDADLTKYGLANEQNPAVAVVKLDGRSVTLRFGRPPARPDEPDFARPCYARGDDLMEVLRLGPDVWPTVTRPADAYRRRQLFPDADRVKLASDDPTVVTGRVALLGDAYDAVRVEKLGEPKTAATFKRVAPTPSPLRDRDRPSGEPAITPDRLARAWELDFAVSPDQPPTRDRIDPAKLRTVLTAIPDLWAEKFVDITPEAAGLADADGDKPEYALSVSRPNGRAVTVRIGKVSRTLNRVEERPPPQPFAPPPPPPKVTTEEYRYAKLDDNPLIFEVRSDTLKELFADPGSFRDPRLARFEPEEVSEVLIAGKGQQPIRLTKKKGNPDADREDDREDRWFVGELLADTPKVTDLLDQLSRWEARGPDAIIDHPNEEKWKELGLADTEATKVTVTAQTRVVEGEPPPPARTYTFVVGTDDAEKKKLAVQVAGWPRVNLVDDAVWKAIDRPALAYRGRRLFDTANAQLTAIDVRPPEGDGFALTKVVAGVPQPVWRLTRPVSADADDAKAGQLAGDLARLEATEYVDDDPKPDDLATKYGLAGPHYAVALGFTGTDTKTQMLRLGSAREGTEEVYARLDDGGIFTVPNRIAGVLANGALGLLPLQQWSMPSDQIAVVEIRRSEANGNESYRLTKNGSAWKLSGPFDAPVSYPEVQPLLAAAAAVKAEKYVALAAPDPAQFGFDKPALRLTLTATDSGTPTTRTLVIGNPIEAGESSRFARIDGGPTPVVFALPESVFREADKPALGWLDRSLLSIDPAKVARIEIAGPTPADSVALTRDPQAGGWKAEGDQFALDGPTVEALVQTAARLPIARLAGYGSGVSWAAFGLDKPDHTITLTAEADEGSPPKVHTVKVGKVEPSGERYVRVDDGPAVGVLLPRAAEVLARGKLGLADRTLLAFDPRTLRKVVRQRGDERLEFARAGTGWELGGAAQGQADGPTLDDMADDLAALRAARIAADHVTDADLPTFGLSEPAATYTFTFEGETPEKVLRVGGPVEPSQPDGERYVTAGVGVGILAPPLANRLLADALQFRDKTLAELPDANKATLQRGDRTVTFAKSGGVWKLTEPIEADAQSAELDDLARSLAHLRAEELTAEKPGDLTPFGLDAPEAKWTFYADGKEPLVLLVGAKEPDGPRHFAKTGKGTVVGLLDADLSAKALSEYRQRRVWPDADAAQAIGLVVSSETGGNLVLRKLGAEWADTQSPDDPYDTDKVTETVTALAGLRAERFVADKNARLELFGLDKPTRVLVLTLRGNKTYSLQIGGPVGGTDGKQVYAKAGEPGRSEVFILSKADTAKLTRDRAAYAGKK